jgi:Uma2 family endonuclease
MSAHAELLTKKLFTVEEFQRILDANIFPPDSRQELIRGEIIEADPRAKHSGRVNKLNRLNADLLSLMRQ